ncbi:sensor histidine kinase [Pollutibacter soli]|uniref:sensor histidine kinase n=1 Tax=Pollutibacter soli TaxID=3034157 RepID=UPI003013D7BE
MPGFLNRIPSYWIFQAIGWGMFIIVNTFFAITFDRYNTDFIGRLITFVGIGLIFSHIMRDVIKRTRILQRSLNEQVVGFLLITLFFAAVVGFLDTLLTSSFDILIEQEKELTATEMVISHSFYAFVYLFMWNCIYFIYHYIDKSRSQQFDTLKLQALVKELELKTIKSHINPHFIFNALNSIRALIDENPARARDAITELSNILRSSMQSENQETVPLERELNIVKDYLALEHIRFEDRLKVQYEIDEDTLSQPVPPMMLQTLVENAIKHGISKYENGGIVKIISDFRGKNHELIVQNTGKLNGGMNKSGFGLHSTASRLGLLFGNNARFEIHDTTDNLVEAKVSIPVQ